MDSKLIDLTGLEGTGLRLKLKDLKPGKTFYITLKEPGTDLIYYERLYNKDEIQINLPKHSQKVSLLIIGSPKIDSLMLTPLRKLNIPHDTMPEAKRPFRMSEMRLGINTEMKTPGRFHTKKPLLEVNPNMMKKYTQAVAYYVSLHEIGHYRFNDEEKADRWATIQFLNDGYNLSSANYALTKVLNKNAVNIKRMFAQDQFLKSINLQYFD